MDEGRWSRRPRYQWRSGGVDVNGCVEWSGDRVCLYQLSKKVERDRAIQVCDEDVDQGVETR